MKFILTLIFTIILFCVYNHSTGYHAYKMYYPTITKEIYKSSKEACEKYGIDQRLHIAIGWRESRLKNVRSFKDGRDYGVFQVRDIHCQDNPLKLMNIKYNADVSAKILKSSLNRSYDVKIAVAKYNAGQNANLSKYKSWRSYVYKICYMADRGVSI